MIMALLFTGSRHRQNLLGIFVMHATRDYLKQQPVRNVIFIYCIYIVSSAEIYILTMNTVTRKYTAGQMPLLETQK